MKGEDRSENTSLSYNTSEDERDSNLNSYLHSKENNQGKQYKLKEYFKSEKEAPPVNSPERSAGLLTLSSRVNQAPKVRERADEKQTQLLEDIFSKNQKMTKKVALALKDQIGLSEKFISVWFQNRRVKERNKIKSHQPNDHNKARKIQQTDDLVVPKDTKGMEVSCNSRKPFIVESSVLSELPPKPHFRSDFYNFIEADSKPDSSTFNKKSPTITEPLESLNHPKIFTYTNPHFRPCPMYPDKSQSELNLSADNLNKTSPSYHLHNRLLCETSKSQQNDSAILVQPSAVEIPKKGKRTLTDFKLEDNSFANQLNSQFTDSLKVIGQSNLDREKVKPIVYNFKFKFDYNKC